METKIVTISENDFDFEQKIQNAGEIIKKGGLVVFPTETVYGLGADATNPVAVKKIFEAKGRPSDNPLIIHISKPEEAENYTYTNSSYYRLAAKFMPGPLTVILNSKNTVPLSTRGGLSTVAVRCPENFIARALIAAAKTPIAAPSANISGKPSPTAAMHVIDDMSGKVDMIIDGGRCDFGLESTIVKIESEDTLTLLRPGKITLDDLKTVFPNVNVASAVTGALEKGEKAISPGMKYRHYAPESPFELLDGDVRKAIEYIKKENIKKIAVIAYKEELALVSSNLPNAVCYEFGAYGDGFEQAQRLFYILREADKKNFEKIYAPLPSKQGVGLALYNRMIRAAAHTIIKL